MVMSLQSLPCPPPSGKVRRKRACRLRAQPPEPKALKGAAKHVGQPCHLLQVDVFARNDLGLQTLNLDGQRRGLPDENLAGLAESVLAAEVIRKGDRNVTIATSDNAAAVDAAKE
jgi:hypothetical protein